ncbi:hypothetical protein [Reyranella sp.]|uniref:hypothetical protein n=1 Tax=Reyranella sp. TaxID=1929291 RepID=UPI00120A3955|nr:hypothetical protein [Reyranella sp.]TAJ89740.1 MAG: hypothetical protein EPO50_05075 [Reyranella sp.]
MANLMPVPRLVAVDGNGHVMPGALLYFYVTGTTTPKAVYANAGGSPELSNPVEADANGLFPAIYLGSGNYKVILKTALDVEVWTTEEMSGTTGADTLTTRGDLLTRDAIGYKRIPIGTSGYVFRSNGLEGEWGQELTPYMHINGLTYQNSGDDPSNDITVAIGSAMDASGAKLLVLGSALTKQINAGWAAGNVQGGLDTGNSVDGDYYIWLIHRADTGVTDVLFSASATAPTMPANYTYKRLIGWLKRSGGVNVAFKTYEVAGGGLEFAWVTPRRDVNLATTLTTSRRTDVLSVPQAYSVVAHIRGEASNSGTGVAVTVANPDETDAAPSVTDTPLAVLYNAAANQAISQFSVRTNASGAVASRASNTVDLYVLVTLGFTWGRR